MVLTLINHVLCRGNISTALIWLSTKSIFYTLFGAENGGLFFPKFISQRCHSSGLVFSYQYFGSPPFHTDKPDWGAFAKQTFASEKVVGSYYSFFVIKAILGVYIVTNFYGERVIVVTHNQSFESAIWLPNQIFILRQSSCSLRLLPNKISWLCFVNDPCSHSNYVSFGGQCQKEHARKNF